MGPSNILTAYLRLDILNAYWLIFVFITYIVGACTGNICCISTSNILNALLISKLLKGKHKHGHGGGYGDSHGNSHGESSHGGDGYDSKDSHATDSHHDGNSKELKTSVDTVNTAGNEGQEIVGLQPIDAPAIPALISAGIPTGEGNQFIAAQ